MSFRNLDGEGDWVFGAGRSSYARESQEIALNIKTRIMSFLGDCFFAVNEGIDWWNRLEVGQKNNLDADLQTVITQTAGVTSIKEAYIYLTSSRKYIAKYDIIDIYSQSINDEIEIV